MSADAGAGIDVLGKPLLALGVEKQLTHSGEFCTFLLVESLKRLSISIKVSRSKHARIHKFNVVFRYTII